MSLTIESTPTFFFSYCSLLFLCWFRNRAELVMYPLIVWKTSLAANGCWYFLLFSVLKRKYQIYWHHDLWVMLVNDRDGHAGEEMLGCDFHDMAVNPLSCHYVTLNICFLESIVHACLYSCKQDFGLAHYQDEKHEACTWNCVAVTGMCRFLLVLLSYLLRKTTAGLCVFVITVLSSCPFPVLTAWNHIGHSAKACPVMQVSLFSML